MALSVWNFLFHRVHPEPDPLWPPMAPKHFDRIIRYLTKKFPVRLFEDVASNPPKSGIVATIMFDDGYLDNIEYAAPILDKYGCKASFYVVTDCIDNNQPTWTYNLDHRLSTCLADSIGLDFDFLPKQNSEQRIPGQAGTTQICKNIKADSQRSEFCTTNANFRLDQ